MKIIGKRETRGAGHSTVTWGIAVLAGIACVLSSSLYAAETEASRTLEQIKSLCSRARTPGSPGNVALEAMVAERFKASGFETGEIAFDAPVLTPGSLSLDCGESGTFELDAMHPSLMRPGNFKTGEFDTRLVYLGKGGPDGLKGAEGIDLKDTIAVMEYDSGDEWLELYRFGMAGFVFIGDDHASRREAVTKVFNTEVSVPRYFIDGDEGARLRKLVNAGQSLPARAVNVPCRWKNGELRDLWVVIPGADEERADNAVVIVAPLDANAVVPGRAFGAQRSVNLHILLKLLDDLRERPPKYTVVLAAVNAHTQLYAGERMLAWHLLTKTSQVEGPREAMTEDMRFAQLHMQAYGKLHLDPVSEEDKADLHILMEVMWKLAAPQQEEADTDAGAPIDLTSIQETDLRAAIEQARAKLIEDYGSYFAKAGRDGAEVEKEKQEDLAYLDALGKLSFDDQMVRLKRIKTVFDDEKRIESWRTRMDESTGHRIYIKTVLQDEFKSRRNRLGQEMLVVSSATLSTMDDETRKARLDEIKQDRSDLLKVLVLFNMLDIGVGRSRTYYRQVAVNDVQREFLRRVVEEFLEKYGRWNRQLESALRSDVAGDAIRKVFGTRKARLVISLDLDAHSDRIGFCRNVRNKDPSQTVVFGDHCRDVAEALAEVSEFHPYVDAVSSAADYAPPYWFTQPNSAAAHLEAASGTPSFAFKSAFSTAGRIFGPWDTPEHLDAERVHALQQWTRQYVAALLDHPEILSQESLNVTAAKHDSWTINLRTFSLEQFTGKPIPTREVPDSLVTLYLKEGWMQVMPSIFNGDVMNCYVGISDHTGSAMVYGIAHRGRLNPTAYKMDPDFREVEYTIDKGRVQSSRQINSNVGRSPRATLPLFEAREFVIRQRTDPTLLGERRGLIQHFYWPKSASAQAEPDKYGVHGARCLSPARSHFTRGPVGVYLYHKRSGLREDRLMLIDSSKRCVLGSTEENPIGEGYATGEDFPTDMTLAAARDMAILNRSRAGGMKGVVNELLDSFMARSQVLLAEIDELQKKHAHREVISRSAEALGVARKSYSQINTMNADMLKSIVAYMALMLPFCFFLQKLLFNFKRMEHEIGAFALIFFSLYVGFRFIHPAFRIAMSPEAIFIAFVLGAIGLFTTMVLRMRFQEEMRIVFQGVVSGIGEEASAGTVRQTAVLIGVQNMRRRRVRTILTTATIVLVVFTMLSFSSVSKKAPPTLVAKGSVAPYNGIFYAGKDEESYRALRELFASRAKVSARRLLMNSTEVGRMAAPLRMARVDDRDVFVELHSVTGLPMDDTILRESLALVEGKEFSASDAQEILLTVSAADALNLGPADVGKAKVRLLGREWLLQGLVNDQRYRLARDLDPETSLVPKETKKLMVSDDDDEVKADVLSAGAALVDTATIAIIPEQVAAALGGTVTSVSVILPDDATSEDLATEVNRLLAMARARFFVGSRMPFKLDKDAAIPVKPGSYYVGSGYRTSIGGLSRLIVPLLIAGSIILNTMLGTVYERKSEIAVFNAIGLNPTHIFTFFLAEAFVYSLIGSVGGYLIGQSLAIGLKASGLVQGVNINFSSLIVVYAILFTMALVMVSTIYPGYVATRAAVPSGKRKWAMPDHTDQCMNVIFPFIYRPSVVPGAIAYLYRFFSKLTDQSMSDIVADLEEVSETEDSNGRPVMSLRYTIALAPYDLGVTQQVAFRTQYDEVVRSYRMHMDIERISGQEANWVTTNKPFLERMRKHLIRWRNIDPTQRALYVDEAEQIFKGGALPDAPPPQETGSTEQGTMESHGSSTPDTRHSTTEGTD